MVKVLFTTTDYLDDKDVFESEYQMASEYRKTRINTSKRNEDKKRQLAAEMLLWSALKEAGVNCSGEIVVDFHGKPRLKDNSKVYFSISHSGNRVMCVVADAEVGCDVEKIGRCSEKIAKRYFSKQEIQQIDSEVNNATKAVLCTKIWCLKESFGKLTGLGLGGSLEKTSFDLSGDKVVLTDRAEIECSIWENDGYIYSYCLEGTVQ